MNHKGIIIITQPIHIEITEQECVDALPKEYHSLPREKVEVCPATIRLGDDAPINWSELSAIQEHIFTEKIAPLLEKFPDYTIIYAGLAPIPLMVHLGSLFSNWSKIQVLFRNHTDHKWYYEYDKTQELSLSVSEEAAEDNKSSDVALKIPISFPISTESVNSLDIQYSKIIQFGTDKTNYDVFSNQDQVIEFASKFEETLRKCMTESSDKSLVHLFASVPAYCAFVMGTKIQPNIHPHIQTYQYKGAKSPQYEKAILIDHTQDSRTLKKVLCVVATKTEAKELISRSKAYGHSPTHSEDGDLVIWNLGRFNNSTLYLVKASGMGSLGAGGSTLTINDAINKVDPEYVIMPGIAMGLNKPKQPIGTVLVSSQLSSYEIEKVTEDKNLKRSDVLSAGQSLLSRFQSADLEYDGDDIKFGLILSGEKLVDNKDLVTRLKEQYPEAIGVEMEGSGLIASSYKNGKPWILIKGVCDYGFDKNSEGTDKEKDQKTAITNVCDFLFYTLMNFEF
jgi:nucleoside phosphorylase